MTKELKNRILENKVLTYEERMEIVEALEQQENKGTVVLIKPSKNTTTLRQLMQQPVVICTANTEVIAQSFISDDDCVSRQSMLDAITEIDENINMDIYTNEVREIIEALPPVTPGTCKDCIHRDPEDKKCDCGHSIVWQLPREDNWYCKDFEKKRGSDNG